MEDRITSTRDQPYGHQLGSNIIPLSTARARITKPRIEGSACQNEHATRSSIFAPNSIRYGVYTATLKTPNDSQHKEQQNIPGKYRVFTRYPCAEGRDQDMVPDESSRPYSLCETARENHSLAYPPRATNRGRSLTRNHLFDSEDRYERKKGKKPHNTIASVRFTDSGEQDYKMADKIQHQESSRTNKKASKMEPNIIWKIHPLKAWNELPESQTGLDGGSISTAERGDTSTFASDSYQNVYDDHEVVTRMDTGTLAHTRGAVSDDEVQVPFTSSHLSQATLASLMKKIQLTPPENCIETLTLPPINGKVNVIPRVPPNTPISYSPFHKYKDKCEEPTAGFIEGEVTLIQNLVRGVIITVFGACLCAYLFWACFHGRVIDQAERQIGAMQYREAIKVKMETIDEEDETEYEDSSVSEMETGVKKRTSLWGGGMEV